MQALQQLHQTLKDRAERIIEKLTYYTDIVEHTTNQITRTAAKDQSEALWAKYCGELAALSKIENLIAIEQEIQWGLDQGFTENGE